MVEFVLNRSTDHMDQVLFFVEAKSSSPQPGNKEDFSEFIQEISEKMINGISLLFAISLHRHGAVEETLPTSMHAIDITRCKVRCVLIINGHKDEWLPPIKDQLYVSLRPIFKTWNFGPKALVVLNESLAAKYP